MIRRAAAPEGLALRSGTESSEASRAGELSAGDRLTVGDPAPTQDRRGSPQQNLEVTPRRSMFDIVDVVCQLRGPIHTVASVHLGPTRQTRACGESATLCRRVVIVVVEQQRTRADQAHVATQHAPQLWEFVEAARSETDTECRQPVLVIQELSVGVDRRRHRSKLQQFKRLTVQSCALLTKDHR